MSSAVSVGRRVRIVLEPGVEARLARRSAPAGCQVEVGVRVDHRRAHELARQLDDPVGPRGAPMAAGGESDGDDPAVLHQDRRRRDRTATHRSRPPPSAGPARGPGIASPGSSEVQRFDRSFPVSDGAANPPLDLHSRRRMARSPGAIVQARSSLRFLRPPRNPTDATTPPPSSRAHRPLRRRLRAAGEVRRPPERLPRRGASRASSRRRNSRR